jgi:hypothetical protein
MIVDPLVSPLAAVSAAVLNGPTRALLDPWDHPQFLNQKKE